MTKMRRAAFDAASRLPPDERNAIAAALLATVDMQLHRGKQPLLPIP